MSRTGREELENLAREAWESYNQGHHAQLDDIYKNIFPYCLRVASRTCSRFISEQDEEAGIARMALWEAFEKYDVDKGSFLSYLGQVINHRLIDYKRREKRQRGFYQLSSLHPLERPDLEMVDDHTVDHIVDDLARQQDIVRLQELMSGFGITFEDLVKSNPKHARTRKQVKEIAWQIAEYDDLTQSVIKNQVLPIKELEERFGANRKLIDRFRKYIIVNVLILTNDFSSLKNYILPEGEGDS